MPVDSVNFELTKINYDNKTKEQMIKHYLPNPIYSLLLVLISYTSCNGQVQTNPDNYREPKGNADKPQTITDNGLGMPKTSDEMKSFLDAGVDPYFVETKDTISTHGPQCIVRNMIQDKAGNYWLATWHGIIKYDGKVFTNYTLKEGLIHFHVVSLFESSNGNIWFGSARGGVYRYDPSPDNFRDSLRPGSESFTLFTTKDGLPDNTVNCIAEDKSGNIWFGTENGLSRYDPSPDSYQDSLRTGGKTFTNFTTKDGLCDNYINAVIKDKTGKLWIGTNNGINWYDPSHDSYRDLLRTGSKPFTKFTDKDSLPFQKVASLFEDKTGNIWIGSSAAQQGGKGLCRYDPSASLRTGSQSVSCFVTPYFVMYMCEDRKGNLWLAHNKGADNINFILYSYDRKSFTKIIEQNKPDNPLIFGIMADKDGRIWFGTAKGVCRYDPSPGSYGDSPRSGGKTFTYFSE